MPYRFGILLFDIVEVVGSSPISSTCNALSGSSLQLPVFGRRQFRQSVNHKSKSTDEKAAGNSQRLFAFLISGTSDSRPERDD